MSVLLKTDDGWVLDHGEAVCGIYKKTQRADTEQTASYKWNPDLFDIRSPFMMNSQAAKRQVITDTDQGAQTTNRKRKRKRQHALNEGETLALKWHEKVRSQVLQGFHRLMTTAREAGHLNGDCDELAKGDNNGSARAASQILGPGDGLADLCHRQTQGQTERPVCSFLTGFQKTSFIDLGYTFIQTYRDQPCSNDAPLSTVCQFKGDNPAIVTLLDEKYFLPPHCSFLLSDVQGLVQSYSSLGKFDLVVMDPPWENKSVKRKKQYYSLGNSQLLELPIQQLTAAGCTLAVWVTNRQKHIQFVKEELFPAWGVCFIAQWYWIKVTQGGEMVYDFDSPHKKPYETLLLGRSLRHDNVGDIPNDDRGIPDGRLIVSVPCSIHSKKPPLFDVLKSYLPYQARCLELFSRNLWPGWTSWGNEVLLHQHEDFFVPVT